MKLMQRVTRRARIAVILGVLASIMLLAGVVTFHVSERWGLRTMEVEANHRLDMLSAAADSMVNHYAHVPIMVELSPEVQSLLQRPKDLRLEMQANRYLEKLNTRIESIAIYVMDLKGLVLASSNWNRTDSFVGDNYSFRPYFQDAVKGEQGHYFAVGTTRGEPGYYVSHPIRDGERIIGVAVIKLGLAKFENSQLSLGSPLAILDDNGVVIISSVLGWKFKSVTSLPPEQLAELNRTRRYNQLPIGKFPLSIDSSLTQDTPQLVTIPRKLLSQSGESYGPGRFMMQARSMPNTGWRLVMFSDTRTVRNQAVSHAALAVMAAGFIALAWLTQYQRRSYFRQKIETQHLLERTNAELEQKVEERTVDLVAVNDRLRAEIAEREKAEHTLRSAQDELVQTAKLAVLGRMATGITHELAQPLGALRTLAGNAIEFMKRGDQATAQGNLTIIGQLVDQMGSIIVPLKTFARKSPAYPQAVDVSHVVSGALFLFDQRMRKEGIAVDNQCQPDAVIAWCDQNRLQQVLINLIGNAADAMADSSRPKRLTLSAAYGEDGGVVVKVADTGPGFSDDVLEHLFEPFFTTKPMGEGLGIGLAISQDIVRDFGGALSAANGPDGGAVFTIALPAVAGHDALV
ncbi:MAG TPA: ATP-binding protein [Rhodocyclaceae bacterium]|nr:ATP-binding protein [Rhodocyclaceae bacterium]